jgi:hypothetical protein
MNNEERAEYAEESLIRYCLAKEGRDGYDNRIDEAADLICDLLHLIRSYGGNPDQKLSQAAINFDAEEADEAEGAA